ncbi:hypothetical protein D3C71_1914240 [compost metagenome]
MAEIHLRSPIFDVRPLTIVSTPVTPEQVWKNFRGNGNTVAQWARANGFDKSLVYAVLRGQRKCLRGQSHDIAVALGLKHP